MKKSVILVILAICLINIAYALPNGPDSHPETTTRYTNVMGDNVHIIRIQELSEKLEFQLEELENKNKQLESNLNKINEDIPVETQEIQEMKSEINTLKTQLSDFKQGYAVSSSPPSVQPSTFLFKVLLANTGLFVMVLVGLVYIRREPKGKLESYIKRNKNTLEPHEIKLNLLSKGWKINQIEKAFKK